MFIWLLDHVTDMYRKPPGIVLNSFFMFQTVAFLFRLVLVGEFQKARVCVTKVPPVNFSDRDISDFANLPTRSY